MIRAGKRSCFSGHKSVCVGKASRGRAKERKVSAFLSLESAFALVVASDSENKGGTVYGPTSYTSWLLVLRAGAVTYDRVAEGHSARLLATYPGLDLDRRSVS